MSAISLSLSPFNVRKTYAVAGIEQLAQLILAEGVLQNLNVHRLDKSAGQSFGVVAGRRRLRALQVLVQDKQLKPNHPVPCLVVSIERAQQISLAENLGREAMHPSDELEAFKSLVDASQPIQDIAARFGVSPLVVQRRLKLANVLLKLIAAYRDDRLSLECLDVGLIEELAGAKLAKHAEKLKSEGLPWVEIYPTLDYQREPVSVECAPFIETRQARSKSRSTPSKNALPN